MAKYKVVRTWYVEANNTNKALIKTRSFDHDEVIVSRITKTVNMLFVNNIPGGTRVACENCEHIFIIKQNITSAGCPKCKCNLVYSAGASW